MAAPKPNPDPFEMFCYATCYWNASTSLGREANPLPYCQSALTPIDILDS
jgi:hypothetical protein